MTNTAVPLRFIRLMGNDVAISHVPNSADWRAMALDANWLNGRGSQLIPCTFLHTGSFTSNLTYTYEVATFPRPQALERTWIVGGKLTIGAVGGVTLSVTASGHLSSAVAGSTTLGVREGLIRLQESVSDTTSAVSFLGLTASFTSGSGYVSQLSLWEHPRALLCTTRSADDSVHAEGFTVRTPIWADSSLSISDTSNVRGVVLATSSAIGNARKAGVWYYVAPVRVNGTLNKTGTDTGVLRTSTTRQYFSEVSSSIQARRINTNQTTAEVDIYVLGSYDTGGDKLIVEFETESGNTTTLSLEGVSADTPTWFSGTLFVRTDGTDSTGSATPAAGTDRFNFSYYTVNGNASVYAVCIGEKHRDF